MQTITVRYVTELARKHQAARLGISKDEKGRADWNAILQKCRMKDAGGIYEKIDVVDGREPHPNGLPHVLISMVRG